ncbi:hypothetical protein QQF64_034164 [Cirrhinus molitorella]|uniref:Uncharacterized protein n=1 Tax=Cirrhinus molitorella TaxID=172907 RepID=A0ABR3MW26_9TELE
MDEELQPAGAIIQQTQPQLSQQRRRCGNCGSIHHANRSPNCPAIGQKCRHCERAEKVINEHTGRLDALEQQVIDLQDRSRRSNLRLLDYLKGPRKMTRLAF